MTGPKVKAGQGAADYVALELAFCTSPQVIADTLGGTIADVVRDLYVNGHVDVSRALLNAARA